jgi:hypothetical protein
MDVVKGMHVAAVLPRCTLFLNDGLDEMCEANKRE